MSVTKISIGAQINQAFQPIHEFVTSYNDRDHLPFSNGRTLSKDDCTQLRLILNDAGSKRLWAPFKETDTVVDCLENLDEWLQHTQDLLQDRIEYLKGLPNPPSYEDWTISEVYNKSYQFHQLLSNCVYYGVLGNEAFHPEGSRRRAFEHFRYVASFLCRSERVYSV